MLFSSHRFAFLLFPFAFTAVLAQEAAPPETVQLSQTARPPFRPTGKQTAVPPIDLPANAATGTYRALSAVDHALYAKALAAADRGDWKSARALAAQGDDPVAGKFIAWRFLTDRNSTADFAEYDRFLKANPTWPLHETLQARAESKFTLATPAAAVLAWFVGREPVTAMGKICLGQAEIAAGKTAAGAQHIRTGWQEGSFAPAAEAEIEKRFSSFLTPDVEAGRLDALLWKNDDAGARRQMERVDETTRAIGLARLAVKTGARDAPALIAALPAAVAANAGLKFDQAHALRKAGDEAGAQAMLRQMPLEGLARAHPGPLWVELAAAVRQTLQEGDARTAYQMLAGAGFAPRNADDPETASGSEYSEAQFLAGWIALRLLHDPQAALWHFRNFSTNVSRPISIARGAYWQGRTYEDLGDQVRAWNAYRVAAGHNETFYGMLALTRIEDNPTMRIRDTAAKPLPAGVFEKDELVRVMQMLADEGQVATLRRFALHYREIHPDAAQTKRLLQFLTETGMRPVVVRVAKAASYDGQQFLTYAFPVIPVPPYSGPGAGPEEAFVLSLIRQETEFDVAAVSPTGARGLMQVIPSGAKGFAKAAGVRYRQEDLTRDATYNMQLGMTMVADYLRRWNQSLILGASAYNAGPTYARRWVNAFGDPRTPATDPVDWIERIPFGETRNYVQRVIENLQVYRALLAGREQPLKILDDLYGDAPHPRPLRYRPRQSR